MAQAPGEFLIDADLRAVAAANIRQRAAGLFLLGRYCRLACRQSTTRAAAPGRGVRARKLEATHRREQHVHARPDPATRTRPPTAASAAGSGERGVEGRRAVGPLRARACGVA